MIPVSVGRDSIPAACVDGRLRRKLHLVAITDPIQLGRGPTIVPPFDALDFPAVVLTPPAEGDNAAGVQRVHDAPEVGAGGLIVDAKIGFRRPAETWRAERVVEGVAVGGKLREERVNIVPKPLPVLPHPTAGVSGRARTELPKHLVGRWQNPIRTTVPAPATEHEPTPASMARTRPQKVPRDD